MRKSGNSPPVKPLLLLFAFLILTQSCAVKKVLVIDKSGRGDYTSIREAINDWEEGQTIEIRAGEYDEQIILRTGLKLVGAASENTKVAFSGEGPTMAGKDVSSVSVSNLTLEKKGAAKHPVVVLDSTDVEIGKSVIRGSQSSGIEALRFGFLNLSDSLVENNGYAGIFFHDRARGSIKGSRITGNIRGIEVRQYPFGAPKMKTVFREEEEAEIIIENNTIEKNGKFGIVLDMGSRAELTANNIVENGLEEKKEDAHKDRNMAGLIVRENSRAEVVGNTFIGNNKGAVFYGNSGGRVSENVFKNNRTLGVSIKGPSKLEISRNIFEGNLSGIHLREGTEALIVENEIRQSDSTGIEIVAQARPRVERNLLYRNGKVGILVKGVSKPFIRGNFLVENGWHGVLVIDDSRPFVINNTFYGNVKVGAWFRDRSEGVFSSNVVVGGKIGLSIRKNKDFAPKVEGNCFYRNEESDYQQFIERPSTDIYADPLFRNPDKLDFTPMPASPLLRSEAEGGIIGASDPNAEREDEPEL